MGEKGSRIYYLAGVSCDAAKKLVCQTHLYEMQGEGG